MTADLQATLEPESIILAAILTQPAALDIVRARITVDDFVNGAYRTIWTALVALSDAKTDITHQSVWGWIKDHRRTPALGMDDKAALRFFVTLAEDTPDYSVKLDPFIDRVVDKARMRALKLKASEVIGSAESYTGDVQVFADRTVAVFREIADRRETHSVIHVRESLRQKFEAWDLERRGLKIESAVSTGYAELDRLLMGGMKPTKSYVIAARPKKGKTALALNIATNIAAKGHVVLYFTMEMTHDEMTDRQLSFLSGVPLELISQPLQLTDQTQAMAVKAATFLEKYPILFDDTPRQSLLTIRAKSKQVEAEIKRKGGAGIGAIVIDQLQRMDLPVNSWSAAQAVSDNSSGLKQLACELKVPVIINSQMNRDVEKRGGKPQLSDLADSGGIERDHDCLMFIHKEKRKQGEQRNDNVELMILAQRSGPTGTIDMHFNRPIVRFEQVSFASPPDAYAPYDASPHWTDNPN